MPRNDTMTTSQHHHSHHIATIRRLALSRCISIAFSEAAHVALVALVYQRTHSAQWVAAVMLAGVVTYAVVAPFAGLLGDRFDRRRVMVCSELGAAVCFALLAFVHDPWHIVVLVVANAALVAPFGPAIDAAVPNLVPSERLEWANALIGSARTMGQLVGPLAGGVLVAAVGPAPTFAANAVSFVVSVALVLSTRGVFQAARMQPEHGEADDGGLLAGVHVIARDGVLRTLIMSWCLVCVGFGVVTVAELPLSQTFGMGEVGYGAIASAWALGSLLGAVVARRSALSTGGLRTLGVSTGACAAAMGAVAVSPWFTPVVLSMAFGGFAMAIAGIVDTTLVQQRTCDLVRSRVLAANQALVVMAFGAALGAGGLLLELIGVRGAYAVATATCACAALRFLLAARRTSVRVSGPLPLNAEAPADTRAPVAA